MNPRAWAILVVSSEGQAETLGHQRAWARTTCAERGWDLDPAGCFSGVSTGKDGPRQLVRDMLAALRALEPASRPQWLLLVRLDRLGREALECQFILRDIMELGVRVWTRDGGEERGDSAMAKFISAAKLHLAEHENEVRRDKARAGIARRRVAGMPVGKVPYGLQRAPNGQYVAREPQAEAVREAFRLRLEGAGGKKIARHLTAIAAPYPYTTGERPVRWDQRRVYRLLKNRAYLGTVVDEIAWERVQRIGEATSYRPEPRKYAWPLSGVLRCWCGRNMVGKATGSPHLKRRYYLCPATWNHAGSVRMVRAEEVESLFLDTLHDLTDDPSLIASFRSRPKAASPVLLDRALRTVRKRLEDVDRKQTAVWDLHLAGKVRDEDVQARLDGLTEERARLLAEVTEIERQRASAVSASQEVADVLAELQGARRVWARATAEEQREIAQVVALAVGGFCVERDGELSARWPEDQEEQVRRKRRSASRTR